MALRQGGIPRYRRQAGPALFDQGFRPFFLGAGVYAVAGLIIWLLALQGQLGLSSPFDPLTWHVHEMLFGYVGAAIAGFLLTAIPNWTGRMPLQGWPLALLLFLWLAGRVAVTISGVDGAMVAAAVDLSFPLMFLAVVLREILAGRNWRNLPMVVALALWFCCNLLMHLEPLAIAGTAALGSRLAIATVVMLIVLIGGRVIPSFTRNWLAKRNAAILPAAFGWADRLAMAGTALALLTWVAAPEHALAGLLLAAAALLNLWRLARWCGYRTLAEPLLWVLHLGYLWIAFGLALLAVAILTAAVPSTTALHALTVGGFGTMTLAVMTRATLGHTGRALTAGWGTTVIYLAVTAAAISRVAFGIAPGGGVGLLHTSGAFWIIAFAVFVGVYGPMLWRPRPSAG